MKHHNTCIALSLSFLALCTYGAAHAGIPQPDVVLYGSAFAGGELIENNDNITLIARVNGVAEPIALYRFQGDAGDCDLDDVADNCELDCGADGGPCDVPGCGGDIDGNNDTIPDACQSGQYILRLRIESLVDGSPQSNNAALVGQTASIFTKQEPGGPEELIATYDITSIGALQQLTLGGTGNVFITSTHSCVLHGDGGPNEADLCIDLLAQNNPVEPRLGGPQSLRFGFSDDIDSNTVVPTNVQINCVGDPAGAFSASLGAANEIIISLDAPIADLNCCTIGFNGVQSIQGGPVAGAGAVIVLAGDIDFSTGVSGGDAAIIKPHFNEIVGDPLFEPQFDYDHNGGVTGGDFALIKPLFNRVAPTCP